jgi:hypothetical protein
VLALRVTVTRYTDPDFFPPLVEAEFVDAEGRLWHFVEKRPIFLVGTVRLPADGTLHCSLRESHADDPIVAISTPGYEALEDGQTTFRVHKNQLVDLLDRPRIRVDFNDMIAQDLVCLSRDHSARNSAGDLISLHEGMQVHLYMEDADETGVPSNLLATGLVERNDAEDWSQSFGWQCRIDRWEGDVE